MPTASAGLFFIDFFCKPFVKIFEKMPLLMVLLVFLIYGAIAYVLLRSAYMADQH
jgi:hypothetical protein